MAGLGRPRDCALLGLVALMFGMAAGCATSAPSAAAEVPRAVWIPREDSYGFAIAEDSSSLRELYRPRVAPLAVGDDVGVRATPAEPRSQR